MEVFVAYTKDDDFNALKQTLEYWGRVPGVEPAMIQFPRAKYEIGRRVAADNLSTDQYYILADLGCILNSEADMKRIEERLKDEDAALIGLSNIAGNILLPDPPPAGVRICRKGAVEKWLPKVTVHYNQEHRDSVRLSQQKVTTWHDIFYKHLPVH
jgi:hypothetical protein